MDKTPIEIVADELGAALVAADMGDVGDVLIPEQCCEVVIGDRLFQLTLTEVVK